MASTTRSRGAPTARRQAIETSLLEATETLLEEGVPFSELSVERIARRAGISRTAFYFYFADKRELLIRLTEDVNALILEQASLWWEHEGEPADRVRQAIENSLAIQREHAALLGAVAEAATYDEKVAEHQRHLVARVAEVTERHVEAENAAGHTRCADPRATAFALTLMTEAAFRQLAAAPGESADEGLVEALTAIWVRSIYLSD
ncbi:MAG: TetR/AcrR family transcriptional regulator [Solirubrobacteraceae bacterium]|nr:TetR/AcrR family transcriptional regulator [Solirubrobacteraceae bacterium]